MPLVNGCTFPLKKVKASTFAAVAAQINPTTSEKIDAAASAWRAKQKNIAPHIFSLTSHKHTQLHYLQFRLTLPNWHQKKREY